VFAYPELLRSGGVALLLGLLSHENADIVIDVVEVIHELTDEDVGNEAEQDDDEEKSAEVALKMLIEGFVSHSLFPGRRHANSGPFLARKFDAGSIGVQLDSSERN
jgi:Catenin-beta-like, Arm-motif containing nuclear